MTVIVKTAGSLFDETAEMFVNAVNCQGISGRGIALEFKTAFRVTKPRFLGMPQLQ